MDLRIIVLSSILYVHSTREREREIEREREVRLGIEQDSGFGLHDPRMVAGNDNSGYRSSPSVSTEAARCPIDTVYIYIYMYTYVYWYMCIYIYNTNIISLGR